MAEIIRMPKMSDTMTEGVIVAWNKKVGDPVKSGDILAEVETDKATMELENYVKGTLLHIGVEQGQAVPVDAIIAIVGKEGEDISSLLSNSGPIDPSIAQPEAPSNPEPSVPVASTDMHQGSTDDHRVKASPLAKKMAADLGLSLSQIQGSGDHGRIVRRDIENYQGSAVSGTPQASGLGTSMDLSAYLNRAAGQGESFKDLPLSQMRKTIARRLSESKNAAPHFYLTMEIDMDQAVEARARLNQNSPVKISVNDLVIKAAAMALRQHPVVNSSWLGDRIRQNEHIHIGVAMALPEGLVVPVLRFADQKNLVQLASQSKDFAAKAREKKLQPQDWEGNTFTISNLGMFGIEAFTAIINPPDACIMAVGAVRECPVVRNGQLGIGQRMTVTLSCDHRVVDGATGAAFLQSFALMLRDPVSMLL
ncbi:MAG: pyruvate dehydrogenase complex dihydrolipoamide acetyltransferase [Sphingobacteriia bacterium]|jgi:pyruvate dehydrogenase E2 component (dihydrolipoamide acetyltransferase)|nr:pyruvate dehydrogenase complex dihydrolipoamide acetyltransferase [Sphingobacteriia bacterium]